MSVIMLGNTFFIAKSCLNVTFEPFKINYFMWLLHNANCSKSCSLLEKLISDKINFQKIDIPSFKFNSDFLNNLIDKLDVDYH